MSVRETEKRFRYESTGKVSFLEKFARRQLDFDLRSRLSYTVYLRHLIRANLFFIVLFHRINFSWKFYQGVYVYIYILSIKCRAWICHRDTIIASTRSTISLILKDAAASRRQVALNVNILADCFCTRA